jgi:hypothetical protein
MHGQVWWWKICIHWGVIVRRVRRVQGYNAGNTLIHAGRDICEAPNIQQGADEKQLNYPNAITVML